MKNDVNVTIVMPCLNEAKTLPYCIQSAQEAIAQLKQYGLTGEILISDNGSTDGSQDIAGRLGARIVACPSRGYGNALICGIKAAKGEYVIMGDSDASYDFKDAVPMVLKLREGYDICMGSRFKGRIMPGAMPWKNRYIGNPILTGILNLFYRSGLSDAHCGLRTFTKSAFKRMRLSCAGMEFASEMVVRAALLNLKRTEVPITLYPDKRGRPPHLQPWQDGRRHLKFLLMYGPLWLFFLPGITMMLLASLIFIGVSTAAPYQVFSFGQLRFGDHWMVLASGMFLIGFQMAALGYIALIYRVHRRLLPISRLGETIYRINNLKNAAIIGALFISAGLAIIAYVIWEWSGAGFGALYRLREMIIATTFLVTGLQICFNGLLMVVLGLGD